MLSRSAGRSSRIFRIAPTLSGAPHLPFFQWDNKWLFGSDILPTHILRALLLPTLSRPDQGHGTCPASGSIHQMGRDTPHLCDASHDLGSPRRSGLYRRRRPSQATSSEENRPSYLRYAGTSLVLTISWRAMFLLPMISLPSLFVGYIIFDLPILLFNKII